MFVPDECVVGEVNGGWKVARTTLANERVALSATWGYGSGVTELLGFAANRGSGLAPLRSADLEQLGRFVCEGHALDLLGLRITLKQLSGTEPGATSSVRKLLGMQHAQRIADFCLAALRPGGHARRGPARRRVAAGRHAGLRQAAGAYWSRQVLFTQALTIGGGTTDIQLNIIAERLLGLPRDLEPVSGPYGTATS